MSDATYSTKGFVEFKGYELSSTIDGLISLIEEKTQLLVKQDGMKLIVAEGWNDWKTPDDDRYDTEYELELIPTIIL